MKKMFVGSLLFLGLFLSSVHRSESMTNWRGDTYVISAWQSSVTCSAETFVAITTFSVDFGGVIITSGGVGSPLVGVYNSTNSLIISTIDARTASATPYGFPGVDSSSYPALIINSIGGTPACITTLWQYKRGPPFGFR